MKILPQAAVVALLCRMKSLTMYIHFILHLSQRKQHHCLRVPKTSSALYPKIFASASSTEHLYSQRYNNSSTMELSQLPPELFGLIIKHLVVIIGPYKAVLLRSVNRAFDAAILNAICVSQVADIDDRAISNIVWRMPPFIRAKIFVTKAAPLTVAANQRYRYLQQSTKCWIH